MRMIREVLRLKFDCGLSDRQIGKTAGMARSTVGDYVRRFQEAGLVWPLSEALRDRELEACLFPPLPAVPSEAAPAAGLAGGPSGVAPQGRDAVAAVAGVQGGAPRGFPVQPGSASATAWCSRR